MNRLGCYTLAAVLSFLAGLVCYLTSLRLAGVPPDSDFRIYETGMYLFYVFVALPSYVWILLLLRLFRLRSLAVDTAVLVLSGIIPTLLVPLTGFNFMFFVEPFYLSSFFWLIFSFFAASGTAFAASAYAAERYLEPKRNRQHPN